MALDEEDLTPEVIEEIIKMEEDELKLVLRDMSLENEYGEWFGNVGDLRWQGQNMLVGKLIEMLRRRRRIGLADGDVTNDLESLNQDFRRIGIDSNNRRSPLKPVRKYVPIYH